MEIGDIVKGEAARINGGPVTGSVIAIRENTLIISSDTGGTETIRKKGAEFVSEAKILQKKCYQCGKMLELAEYRTLRNSQKDKVCKWCRAQKVREGLKNKNEKVEGINNNNVNGKTTETKDETAELISSEKKICVQVGKAFVYTNKDEEEVLLTLNHEKAESLPDETIAKQIANDYGGQAVAIEMQVLLKVLE